MAAPVTLRPLSVLILVVIGRPTPEFVSSQETTYICNNTGVDFQLRPGSRYCYRIWQAKENFIEANKTCSRNNAALVRIDSEEENEYVNSSFFVHSGHQDFWIGLSDITEEGVFRWTDGASLVYNGWASSSPVGNANNYDCVKFTTGGWKVEQGFCGTTELLFVCRQSACNTTDGQTCIGTTVMDAGTPTAIIVSSVLVPIIVIVAVVAVIIALFVLYKFKNDIFYKYLCCCLYRASQFKVTSMQQEIQQLRHQLSQQKLSFSGRYQPGEFSRQMSRGKGVPTDPGSPQHPPPVPMWNQVSTKVAPIRSPSVVSGPPTLLGSQPYPAMHHSFSSAAYLPFKARALPAIKEMQTPVKPTTVAQLQAKTDPESSGDSESEDASSTKSEIIKDKQQEE